MARKTTKDPETTTEAGPKLKPVRLDLSQDVHRLLRLVAADEGVSMAAYARDAFEQHVRAEAKKRRIKG
jgi:predicted HicB family RNase H-like nuclease